MRYCIVLIFLVLISSSTVGARGSTRDRSKRNQQVERTVSADPRVLVLACTLSGSFTVRGWDRGEVRVRVSNGVEIELTRIDQTKSERATELKLTAKSRRSPAGSSCLMFGDIEMDVPRAGSVKLKTTSGDISVTEVARVNANAISGSVTIAKVKEETSASAISGEISVRDSTGSFRLNATGGGIDVRNVRPVAATDSLSASTVSGEVTMAHVEHQRVSVNSVSGEVTYSGGLTANGSYSFQSLSGEVRLSLPAASSFRLAAMVGATVKINSDFALKYTENQNIIPPGNRSAPRRVNATFGAGEALIKVSMLSGSLRIAKQ